MPLNTTPRTWVTGELLTATLLNVELRDALTNLQAAWTAWTPSPALTVVSGTNPTMGKSTVVGATHPFSIGGILSNEDPVGYGQVLAGGTRRAIQVYVYSATTGFMVRTSSEADLTASGPGVAWAAGQVISLTGVYQSA